jgi:hypothetical protein
MKPGPYTLNPCNSYFSVDQYGYMLQGGKHGTGDAILRNYMAYIAYGDEKLLKPIIRLDAFIRHPENDTKISRDVIIYTFCVHKQNYEGWVISSLFRILKKKKNNPHLPFSLRCWLKAMAGNKTAHFFYLLSELLTVNLYYRPLHYLGYKIAGWGEEVDQDEWEITHVQNQSWLNNVIDKIVFPSYALHFSGHQLRSLPDRFPILTRWLKRSYGAMVGKTNYAQRLLFDLPVTEEQVRNYRPMSKNRWTGYLNGRNDRYLVEIPEQEYNNIDRDYLIALYNEKLKR